LSLPLCDRRAGIALRRATTEVVSNGRRRHSETAGDVVGEHARRLIREGDRVDHATLGDEGSDLAAPAPRT